VRANHSCIHPKPTSNNQQPTTNTPTGSGKTSCYQALQDALNLLHPPRPAPPPPASPTDDAAANPPIRPAVASHALNPKSLDLRELYGCYNPFTSEWQDGLASRIVRAAVAAAGGAGDEGAGGWCQEWVVFDGPVDALWIESMNTGAGVAWLVDGGGGGAKRRGGGRGLQVDEKQGALLIHIQTH